MNLKSLASQILIAKHGAKPPLNKSSLPPKLSVVEKFSPVKAIPYLDEQGRFCVRGGLLNVPVLDALLSVGASHKEIEKHVDPIGTHESWKRWQQIKLTR